MVRAEEEGSRQAGEAASTTPSTPSPSSETAPSSTNGTVPAATPQTAPILEKGQGTAIITGAISLFFGIAYLVVTALIDMRGGEMLPPPPEAFQ